MKNIIYLLFCIVVLSCTKSIDIEYENASSIASDNFLEGVWNGELNCPNCGNIKIYGYRLAITNYENDSVTGTVKISNLTAPNSEYIEFNITGTFKDDILNIKTTTIIADNPVAGTGVDTYYWCKENSYTLTISSDKTNLNGTWTASSNCSYITRKSSSINLYKL